jgi:hypothetical protein
MAAKKARAKSKTKAKKATRKVASATPRGMAKRVVVAPPDYTS